MTAFFPEYNSNKDGRYSNYYHTISHCAMVLLPTSPVLCDHPTLRNCQILKITNLKTADISVAITAYCLGISVSEITVIGYPLFSSACKITSD